ncbi:hypothetical protein ACFLYH_02975, partial [Candidatus Dependentiae bacterium]
LSCSFVNYVKENPKESVATLVEFFVPVGIAKFAKLSKLKKLSTLSKSFKELSQTSKSFQSTANTINKVINPIKTVFHETGEVLKIGLEHGKDALRNIIKVVKGEPELVSVGDIYALQFSHEHFKDFEKLSEVVVKAIKQDFQVDKKIMKTKSGFRLTGHAKKQLIERFNGKLSLSKLDKLMNNKDGIRVIDIRTGNINVYIQSELSSTSLTRITVPMNGNRIVSIGFEPKKRIEKFIKIGSFIPLN